MLGPVTPFPLDFQLREQILFFARNLKKIRALKKIKDFDLRYNKAILTLMDN
jgi:hypothetical protein